MGPGWVDFPRVHEGELADMLPNRQKLADAAAMRKLSCLSEVVLRWADGGAIGVSARASTRGAEPGRGGAGWSGEEVTWPVERAGRCPGARGR